MKIERPGFIVMSPYGTQTNPDYIWREFEMTEHGYVTVGAHVLVYEIPDDFDPVVGMISTLREKKKTVLAEAQAAVNRIDEQIQSLLAIENKAGA